MDFSGTFDSTNALACMFLWLIFGFLTTMVNCDIQRFLNDYPIVFHSFGFVAFFFLFTLMDTNNKSSIGVIWIKTFFVYILVILMTKSKWYFIIPVLALLLIDQSIKKQIAFKKTETENNDDYIEKMNIFQNKTTQIINYAIIILIIIGTIDYIRLQKLEYKGSFSFYKFFLTNNKCKTKALNYEQIK